jgi:glycosyl hydrolase group 75 (putative chitosanase)
MSDLTPIDCVNDITVYSVKGSPPAFLYLAGMMIDADGSPRCYGPNNSGIDYTANGGTPGDDWWGGPTDSSGNPVKQKVYDPYPGMYVSGTAHFDSTYDEDSPYRYIDSERIPFIVLPGNHSCGAHLGDACLCYNTNSSDNCYGIYADVGPSSKIGEASMRMADACGISNDPKTGGTEHAVIAYLVFPGSIGKWLPPAEWFSIAESTFKQWGGLNRLEKLLDQI